VVIKRDGNCQDNKKWLSEWCSAHRFKFLGFAKVWYRRTLLTFRVPILSGWAVQPLVFWRFGRCFYVVMINRLVDKAFDSGWVYLAHVFVRGHKEAVLEVRQATLKSSQSC
jgi:hypothetical protein